MLGTAASQGQLRRSLPVFLAFLAMGFIDAIGPFVGPAKEQFNLSNFTALASLRGRGSRAA